jgi:hypothetical protein
MEQAKPDIFLGHLNSSTDLDPVSMDQKVPVSDAFTEFAR